jgi:hypothetical protein
MPVYLEHAKRQSDKIKTETTFKRFAQNVWRKAKNLNIEILDIGFRQKTVPDTSANQKCATARIANNPRNL